LSHPVYSQFHINQLKGFDSVRVEFRDFP